MNIQAISTESLKAFHAAITEAKKIDDSIPVGREKPYGVSVYPDWKEWNDSIEAELSKRNISFTPNCIVPNQSIQRIPTEKIFHEAIKICLEKDDKQPDINKKPYGVRQYPDWKKQSDNLELSMQNKGIPFVPIQW